MKRTLALICALGACTVTPVFAQSAMNKANMMVDHTMKMMDTNADGMISMDERAAACKAMFTATDTNTNTDGMISADEMSAMSVKDMAVMNVPADSSKVAMLTQAKFKNADANGDGMISMDEEDTASKAMFMMADTDKDGSVSKAEISAAMMNHMKKM